MLSELRNLFDKMSKIEESEHVDEAVDWAAGDYRDEEDDRYDQDGNMVDDGPEEPLDYADDDWMMKGGEDGLGIDGDSRHDRQPLDYDEYGDDPWGLGEDERGENVPDDVQISEAPARAKTMQLIRAAEEGEIDYESLASACLHWMSEHEVAQMFDSEFDWLDEELNELSTDKYDTYTQAADKAKDYHDQAADSARKSTEIDGDPADLRLTKHFRKSNNRTRGMTRAKMGKARNTANAAARNLK